MQNFVNYLPQKSFNTFGVVLLTLFGFFAVVVIGISASFSFDTSFHCYDKTISKTKETLLIEDINIKCSLKYQEKFRIHLFFGLLISNFGVVLALSIIYGYLVKHRVEKFAGIATPNDGDDENVPMVTSPHPAWQNPRDVRGCLGHFSTFFIYIIHLIIARIVPLLIFAIVFYLSHIPNNFSCPWIVDPDVERTASSDSNVSLNLGHNLTFIGCTNPVGGKSETLFDVVATVDVGVVTLTFLELCYIAWLAFNDLDFKTDREFCIVYLLRKRKRIRKVMNKVRGQYNPDKQKVFQLVDDFGETEISSRNLEDIYINVIIQEGRENKDAYPETFDRHEIFQAHLQTPNNVTTLTSSAEIFKPKNDSNQKYPRTILVIGRPGIGKTMLTKKLLHQFEKEKDEFWSDKIVILLQLRTCNNENMTLREMLGYGEGLSRTTFEAVYSSILLHPAKTVLIFDGLDELDVDSSLLNPNVNAGQSPNEKMPAFIILKQMFYGNFLPGVTILITSRPTAWKVFKCLKYFERTVEILGFFEEQIREYVRKFCKDDNDSYERIWNHIKGSAELLSLCYIPVNSYIVCLTLKESTESTDTPKTITELYKRAVKVLIYGHHPMFRLKPRPNDYLITSFPEELEYEFSKLKKVAKRGIEDGKLIFERTTPDEFDDLANCGFFHKLSDKRRNYFCFLHLTLQEFLAASLVVDDIDNVGKFLDTHIDNPKWHLVIQFIAGLVGDQINEADSQKVMKKWRGVLTKRYIFYFLYIAQRKDVT